MSLVFSGGEIVEEGSHDELMALDGQYAKMYRAQAQWYNEGVDMQSKLVNT